MTLKRFQNLRRNIFCTYSSKEQACTQQIAVRGNTAPAVLFPTATVCKVQWERAMGLLIWELLFLTLDLAARSEQWDWAGFTYNGKMRGGGGENRVCHC